MAYTPLSAGEGTTVEQFADNIASIFALDSRDVVDFSCYASEWDMPALERLLEKRDLVMVPVEEADVITVARDYEAIIAAPEIEG